MAPAGCYAIAVKEGKAMKLPKILAREEVARSALFRIEALELEFSNGVRRRYERLPDTGHRAVMLIPLTEGGDVLLIREYMAGFHDYRLTLPKGSVDAGESLLEAAQRELREEVGMRAETLTPLKTLSVAPGHMGFTITAVLAEGLTPDPLPGDEPEPLTVVPWPVASLPALYALEDFDEARAIAALQLAALHLEARNR